MKYAGGIAEANRLAEETHVFGVSEAQFQRMVSRIDRVRLFFYRTQIIGRLVPNIYQSLVYLVLIVALAGIFTSGTHHASSLGAIVLLLFRAAQNGQAIQTSYQALQQSLPFIDRLQLARVRYESSALIDGQQPLEGVRTLAFENVCFSYNPGRPVLTDVSFAVEAGEAIGIVGPSGAGKSTLVQILLQLRVPGDGRYLVNGEDVRCYVRRPVAPAGRIRATGTATAARHGVGEHPLLSRPRRRVGRASGSAGAYPRRDHELVRWL